MMPDELDPKEPKLPAALTAAGRALISVIPLAGGPLLELGVFADPMKRRMDRWKEAVAEALNQIHDRVGRLPEELANDERFVSVLAQATQSAVKTHRAEKLTYLRNALISSAKAMSPEGDEETTFVRLIDELSVAHIQVLHELAARPDYGRCEDLEQVYNTFKLHRGAGILRERFRILLEDLFIRSLLIKGDVADYPERDSLVRALATSNSERRDLSVTDLGKRLLAFIGQDPVDNPLPHA